MKKLTYYQVFVRNYSEEGTFKALESDLERIADLKIDVLYLMPIHEIGVDGRKGTLGSPYSIRDYFSINHEYGTLEDLKSLINKTHKLGMKIILDMVFNHTSRDSVLIDEHPEFYYYKDGKLANRVGDWSDITDLDTFREDTQEYLLNVLEYYVNLGIDGFRFDVASLLPLEFFKKIKEKFGNDLLILAESIDPGFVRYLNEIGQPVISDEDLSQYCNALYNYNWFRDFEAYLRNEKSLDDVKNIIANDSINRINCLENHDTERFLSYNLDEKVCKSLIKWAFELKGDNFIYMGQEYGLTHRPSLFDKDPITWQEQNLDYFKLYKELILNSK